MAVNVEKRRTQSTKLSNGGKVKPNAISYAMFSIMDFLPTFIGADLVAVRWKQWHMYMTDIHPNGMGPQRLPGIFSAFASLSYPTRYNIEMDPHEYIQVCGQFSWVLGPEFKEIDKYKKTL